MNEKSQKQPSTANKSAKQGRPKGAKTVDKPESVAGLTRCRACNSTERERYTNPRSVASCGIDPDGKPYNRITWRNTRCKNCGQVRVDKFYEQISENT